MIIKYVIGFVASVVLTLAAYVSVEYGLSSGAALLAVVAVLAIMQAIVQLYFFLHLGEEAKPRVRFLTFSFMTLILVIIVGGSLWIMHNLNYNMMQMTPNEKEYYMTTQRDKGF
jgi:cytochrome o ubiquinol oxidase subunit IV